MGGKAGRLCKICILKKKHPDIYRYLIKSLKIGKISQAEIVKEVNRRLLLLGKKAKVKPLNGSNLSRHKINCLDEKELETIVHKPIPKNNSKHAKNVDVYQKKERAYQVAEREPDKVTMVETPTTLNKQHIEFSKQYIIDYDKNRSYQTVFGCSIQSAYSQSTKLLEL